ncbi:MAG: oligosaccharide flippase family protein [Bacillota bacterium]
MENKRGIDKTLVRATLKVNFSWTLCGNVIYAICQWLVVSVIAKLGDPVQVGTFALALAISAPIFLFFNMNLRVVQATDTNDEYSFNQYFSMRVLTTLIAFLIVILISIFSGFEKTTIIVIIFLAIAKFFESISDILYGYLQKCEQMKFISISKIIRGIISTISMAIILYLTNDLVLATLIYAVTWGVILILYDFKKCLYIYRFDMNSNTRFMSEMLKPSIDYKILKLLFILSLPLGIAGTLDSLNINLPRYFINFQLGEGALGYYAAITYIIISGQTIVGALAQAATPRLAKYYNSDIKQFKLLLMKLFIIGLVIGTIGVLMSVYLGGYILTIFYTPEYQEYNTLFILSMIAASFWYLSGFLNCGIVASRIFKNQIIIFFATTLVTSVACIYLINDYGLNGAALSLILGMFTRFVLSFYWILRILKYKTSSS